ncbi:MAG: phospholipid/cholesterol/gamma-HCH transport system permease protein [Solirubrobacteraceae bacterium]|jgi:phospholipid/cholesterol/gamma-HCH transport system permease protein|nr:phospholipid/cholesterol/gamma-HCH transport system permease protein [Solirubrobacteraceae bacterium]
MAAVTPPERTTKRQRRFGGPLRGLLAETGGLTRFSGQTLAALPGSLRYFSEALRHCMMMAEGTLVLILAMSAFNGASVSNFAYFLLRNIGAGDFFGLITGYVIPRQICTTMFGYVFAAKICCGITAELGAMKIQQEVDALESTGVDPRRYLVGTRLMAVIMFVPIVTVVCLIGSTIGAYLIVVPFSHGLTSNQFFTLHWAAQTTRDLIFPTVTIGTIAIVTTIVACYYGLRTKGGPAEVGDSVARSLVVNLVLLHLIASGFAVLVYSTNQNLPIAN